MSVAFRNSSFHFPEPVRPWDSVVAVTRQLPVLWEGRLVIMLPCPQREVGVEVMEEEGEGVEIMEEESQFEEVVEEEVEGDEEKEQGR